MASNPLNLPSQRNPIQPQQPQSKQPTASLPNIPPQQNPFKPQQPTSQQPQSKPPSSGGSGGSSGGGRSQRNPITGAGEYNLGQGVTVPITPETTKAVQSGRSRAEVILAAAKDNASLGAGKSGNVGALVVSQAEAAAYQKGGGGYVPYYVSQAQTPEQAVIEGSVLGTTQVFPTGQSIWNPFTTRGQEESSQKNLIRAGAISKDVFAFQESPSTFAGAVGTSSKEGYSFVLPKDYFGKYYTEEADIGFAKQARENFLNLPLGTQLKREGAEITTTFAKLPFQVAEFTGSAATFGGRFIKENYQTTFKEGEAPKLISIPKWQSYTFRGTEGLKAIPSVPSAYQTTNIPVITSLTGIGIPKGKDFLGYIGEVATSPEKTLSAAFLVDAGIGGVRGGIKGIKTSREIYAAERAAGASRLSALNVLGGETVAGLSPIQIRQRIFVKETPLRPFGTTQLNKGDVLTTTKIGEANGRQLFSAGEKGMTSYTPKQIDYLVYKPKLTGAELTKGSFNIGEVQVTSLGKNVFAAQDMGSFTQIKGQGTRYVDIIGERPIQTGRYTLGKEPYFGRYTQEFRTFGQSKTASPFGKELDFSVSKSTFKTVEYQEYFGGKYIKGGKAFGKPISGRPQTAKSFDIYTKRAGFENEFGRIDFGTSIGKSVSGGRKMVSQFNIRTVTPKKSFIDIKTFGTGKKLPSGFKVERVYAKGEFGYLRGDTTTSLQQININRGLSTSLKSTSAPMKLKFETGLKTEMKGQLIRPRVKQESIQKQFGSSALRFGTSSIFSGALVTPTTLIGTSSRTFTSTLQPQIPITAQTTSQVQIPEYKVPISPIITSPRGYTGGFDFGKPFVPVPFILPSFGLPEYTPAGRRTRGQKKKRQVSLYSAVYGVKTTKASPLDITGLTQRDIVTGKRRKR